MFDYDENHSHDSLGDLTPAEYLVEKTGNSVFNCQPNWEAYVSRACLLKPPCEEKNNINKQSGTWSPNLSQHINN